ncbi:small G protein signaling modulator 3 isoform X4 [Sminthopsis crassicaudata]|uniref:small G protein signaling modulator 3 isoform X4 n=1 Tax=Sminthopsis crassicaudata TaxID=9301 RepID=UPI003D693FB5
MSGSHTPPAGGPFSALTPSIWPQEILAKYSQREELCEPPELRYDEFGFRVDKEDEANPGKLSGAPLAEDPQQRLRWQAHLEFTHNHDVGDLTWDKIEVSLPRSDKLYSLVLGGIPHSMRPQLWMRLSGALQKKRGSDTAYRDIVKNSCNDETLAAKQRRGAPAAQDPPRAGLALPRHRLLPGHRHGGRLPAAVPRGGGRLLDDVRHHRGPGARRLLQHHAAGRADGPAGPAPPDRAVPAAAGPAAPGARHRAVAHHGALVPDGLRQRGPHEAAAAHLGPLLLPGLPGALPDHPGHAADEGGRTDPVGELGLHLQHAVGHPGPDGGPRGAAGRGHASGRLPDARGRGGPAPQAPGLPPGRPGPAAGPLRRHEPHQGDEDLEALKAKNIKQTELVADLREAILQVARHFQCVDPKNGAVELTPDYTMESHQRDHEKYAACFRGQRRRAKALLDFERHDDDELGFRKNDVITIVSQKDEHCWVGELNGLRGWFPAKFVEVLDERSKEYSAAGDDSVTEGVMDLVRGTLCPALKSILEHGLKKPSLLGGPGHPWLFIEEAAGREVERDFDSVYSRLVLCKTYRLDEDGKVLTPEELLYRAVQSVNMTHDAAHTQMDVKLRSLICVGLNEQVLHLWLEVLCSSVATVEKWYHPWSFLRSPGWVQIKCELRVLCCFAFSLSQDWELPIKKEEKEKRPLKEGVQDMLVKHHLFSWDIDG